MQPVMFRARAVRQWLAVLWVPSALLMWFAVFILVESYLSSARYSDPPVPGLHLAMAVLAVAAAVIAVALVILSVWTHGPARNFLRLDGHGLTYMRFGRSRTWTWSELSAFEREQMNPVLRIRFLLPRLGPQEVRRDRWVEKMTPDGPAVAIQDVYDAPLEKILAALNSSRERALGIQDEGAGTAGSEPAQDGVPPLTFDARPSRKWWCLLIGPPLSLACGLAAYHAAAQLLSPAPTLDSLTPGLRFVVFVLATVGAVLGVYLLVRPYIVRIFLRLDTEGLTIAHDVVRYWSWPEVSAFRLEEPVAGVRRIRFLLTKLDTEHARRDNWVLEITPEGAAVVIRDVYDTPLGEIAAKLNAYRERALGGGTAPT